MSGPAATVTVSDPLSGVKRPALSGGGVSSQLPAKRGREVEPGGDVHAPGLRNGNRPNRGTNVTIPYARLSPLRFLDESSGVRLSPGDVAFVRKKPEGEIDGRDYMMEKDTNLNNPPQQARWRRQGERTKVDDDHWPISKERKNQDLAKISAHGRSGVAGVPQHRMMSSHTHRVVGLDGMNEMLRGGPVNSDMRVGVNVMEIKNPLVDLLPGEYGFLRKLEMLDEYALDGVILSNDEPDSFSSNGRRDNVLFNIAVQGKALLNNGFLQHQVLDDPNSSLSNPTGVEARPRPSRDQMVQMNPTVARSAAWNGANANGYGRYANTSFDFVANFKGQYTAYPLQMFDRNPMVGVNMYVGLRAIGCTSTMMRNLKDRSGDAITPTPGAFYVYFQYMPYSQRICDLIELTNAARLLDAAGNPDPLAMLEAGARDSSSRMVKSGIENDPFSPIKRADWEMMVGTWTVGTVIDTSAARHGQFNSGPPDTSFQCMVNVNVNWMERTHNSAAPKGKGRDLMNEYVLAPNVYVPMHRFPVAPLEPASGPKFASPLRMKLLQLRGHQQNPTMMSRVGGMTVIDAAYKTQLSLPRVKKPMQKPTPVLGSRLVNSLGMLARLQLMGTSITGAGSTRKTVLAPSGDRVQWIVGSDNQIDIIPSSTLPLHIVSSWAAMVTDMETFFGILQRGSDPLKLMRSTPGLRDYEQVAGKTVTQPQAVRYVKYLVLRMVNQSIMQIASLRESIKTSSVLEGAITAFATTGVVLRITGDEADLETRALFMDLLFYRNEVALIVFFVKLWTALNDHGGDNGDGFPKDIFEHMGKMTETSYRHFVVDASDLLENENGDQVVIVDPPTAPVIVGDRYTNLPWDKAALLSANPNPTDAEIKKSLHDTLRRTLEDGNFTSTTEAAFSAVNGYLGHRRGSYPKDGDMYKIVQLGTRDNVTTDIMTYDPSTSTNGVHGSELMYPRDEFEYRYISGELGYDSKGNSYSNYSLSLGLFGDGHLTTTTDPLARRPSFRAKVGISSERIQRAWVMIHRALRRHPAAPGIELGAITGKDLYDVLRIPMFMSVERTTGDSDVDNLATVLTKLYAINNVQFTFGAALRDTLFIGADLFYVRGDSAWTDSIQRDTNFPEGKDHPQSPVEVAAGELAIQELVRRISRSVPNNHPQYGKMYKDPPQTPLLTKLMDYNEVVITWEHFYTYFAFHGRSNNDLSLTSKDADGVPYKHTYYYARTVTDLPEKPTNSIAGGSDEIHVQKMILGDLAVGEMPVLRTDAEDHTGETVKNFTLHVHNLMYTDSQLTSDDLQDIDRVPTKAGLESHYNPKEEAGSTSASAQPIDDVVMGSAPAMDPALEPAALEPAQAPAPAPAAATCVRAAAPTATLADGEVSAVPAAACVAAGASAPTCTPAPTRAAEPSPAPAGKAPRRKSPVRSAAPTATSSSSSAVMDGAMSALSAAACVAARASAASRAPAPAPAPARAPAPAPAPAPAAQTSAQTAAQTAASLMDAPISPTEGSSHPVAVAPPPPPPALRRPAAVGGAAAAPAPQSRASTAALPFTSGGMTPMVSSVLGRMFPGSSTPESSPSAPGATPTGLGAAVPRSPSPTPSSGSNEGGGGGGGGGGAGPKIYLRKPPRP